MTPLERFRDAAQAAAYNEGDNGDEVYALESYRNAAEAADEVMRAMQYLADQVGDPHEEASADELSGTDLADELLNVLWQLGFFAKYEGERD